MTKPNGLGSIPKGLDWLAQKMDSETQQTEIPIKTENIKPIDKPIQSSSKIGLLEGWTRSTFIVKENTLEKLKIIASIQGLSIKDLIDEALSEFLSKDNIKALYLKQISKLQ